MVTKCRTFKRQDMVVNYPPGCQSIMENFSENANVGSVADEKRKRGRPKSTSRYVAERLEQIGLGRDVRTVRSKLDDYYLIHAFGALKTTGDHEQRWPWLFGPKMLCCVERC